jgi:hypothetical protein
MTANFDALGKKLGLNEETQNLIMEEWNTKLSEAREEIAAELREEFAQKYTHDKQLVVESVDKFLTEQIKAEIEELAEDKKKLAAERVQYKAQIAEHTKALNEFINRQLAKEIKEHRSERKDFVEGLGVLENFVLTQLAEEIKEFHGDKQALREERVKIIRESKKHITEAKQNFVSKAAKLIEESIETALRNEITQFKDDITVARENDFGRRVFEAFATEYATTHLNERSEVKKLSKLISEKEEEIQKANGKLVEAVEATQKLNKKLNATQDMLNRDRTMSRLLNPLGKDKASIMSDLLESVKTADLEQAYNKYLPAVLNEKGPKVTTSRKRKALTEDTHNTDVKSERTGDRASKVAQHNDDAVVDDIQEIKRLAGLN